MGHPFDPGPPLKAGTEYCPCEPPSPAAYAKALGAALLAILAGSAGWLVIGIVTGRLYSVTAVLIGLLAGWLVHIAAGRLRSIGLGIIAAAASILASGTGYALLWLPFLGKLPIDRQVSWYHLLMVAIGGAVAYSMAGQRTKSRETHF